jgi:glycosyltransferase involved in cell wall biosynthesis
MPVSGNTADSGSVPVNSDGDRGGALRLDIGVVHITAAEGGGADRYIRDLAASTAARHWIWHAGADIIEDVATGRYYQPGDAAAVRTWRAAAGIGLAHLHGLGDACRQALAQWQATSDPALPYLVTLHDVAFVWREAFDFTELPSPEAQWLATLRPVLAHAAALVAPSAYIAGLLSTHYGMASVRVQPGLAARGIRSGADANRAMPLPVAQRGTAWATVGAEAMSAAAPPSGPVVAAIGALGPHKGSLLLAPIAQAIKPLGARLCVIGYTDTQIERGWNTGGDYFVHGPYADAELPGLLASYGVDLALFPNRLPESFSYTLSEAWANGLPVIVPAAGALGERVAALGGGWSLPPGFRADAVRELLEWLRTPAGVAGQAQVKSAIDPDDPARVPPLSAMAEAFDAMYQRFAQRAQGTGDDAALASLLAANLNGFAFRRELADLARERGELRGWVAKLEGDIAQLKAVVDTLQQHNRELSDIRAAFEKLPVPAQKALFKWAFRGRG